MTNTAQTQRAALGARPILVKDHPMAMRECPKGHVVTDDSLGFCPECSSEGVTSVLGVPAPGPGTSSRREPANQAGSTVALLLTAGLLVLGIGAVVTSAATTSGAENFGRFLVLAGAVPVFIALVAIGASLGFRMSRDR